GDSSADVVLAGVEVGEADQFAVLDVPAVPVVGDLRGAVVEVEGGVQAGVVVLGVRRAAGAGAAARGHVVDHRVGDDLDAGRVAGVDHVLERGAVAEPAGDPVAHRLVRGPPLPALYVLGGRGDLDVSVARGTEGGGALAGDGGEVPLEQDGGDVLGARRGGLRSSRGHDNGG